MTLRPKPNPDDLHTDEPTLSSCKSVLYTPAHLAAIVGPDERMRRRLLALPSDDRALLRPRDFLEPPDLRHGGARDVSRRANFIKGLANR